MKLLAIVLVSEQAIPNVLFLKWFFEKNGNDKAVLFVSTQKMEEKQRSENIKKIFGNIETDTIIVDENSVLEIQKKLKEIDFSNSDVLVNITGGNKLMSSAAFLFFRDKAKIYYQEFSNTNALIDLKTDKKIELNQKITIKEYFAAYGIKANFNEYKKLKPNGKEYSDYFTLINKSEIEDSLKELRNFRDEKSKDKIQKMINENDEVKTMITSFGFDSQSIDKYAIRYITGGWFEEFIFENIKEEEKAIGIKINNTNNELDVVFINDKYELNIIECKSTATDKILSETLYKSRAITKNFGLKTNAIIYTTSKISDNIKKRAEDYNITIEQKNV